MIRPWLTASVACGLSVSGLAVSICLSSKMSLITSAGTAIIHHSKGCSLIDASIPATSFPLRSTVSSHRLSLFASWYFLQLRYDFFCLFSVVTFTSWHVSELNLVGLGCCRFYKLGMWWRGLLLKLARSGFTAPEWATGGFKWAASSIQKYWITGNVVYK